jgi:hypothetical protein
MDCYVSLRTCMIATHLLAGEQRIATLSRRLLSGWCHAAAALQECWVRDRDYILRIGWDWTCFTLCLMPHLVCPGGGSMYI